MAAGGMKERLLDDPEAGYQAAPDGGSWEERQKIKERRIYQQTNAEQGLCIDDIDRIRDGKFNELVEEEVSCGVQFLGYFWGPMPIMIWIAIIIEFTKAIITHGDGWADFGVLLVLQVVNGTVGFIEERNAGNAIAALKAKLAPKCTVVRHDRSGQVHQIRIPSRELVDGDVVELKLGDVVPADMVLIGNPADENDQLQVDESALTGESLPRTAYAQERILMSSTIKQGELKAVVTGTGENTFFGRSAELIKDVGDTQGRFQKILFQITLGLLAISLTLCAIIFIILIVGHDQSQVPYKPEGRVLNALSIVIVLLVASIPIAMQVVCTSTMAVGSRKLADKQVIVARLSAIEELAGMTVLCSDKTGTLTLNELELKEPEVYGEMSPEQLTFFSALAANRRAKDQDAIDTVICNAVPERSAGDAPDAWTRDKLDAQFELVKYLPFNPVIKRTEATIRARQGGNVFKITKGAPQVVLRMAIGSPGFVDPMPNGVPLEQAATDKIQELADRGLRALGVAISQRNGEDDQEEDKWEFVGVLSLWDPPRLDTKETVHTAMKGGVEVKMITGDQTAIAVEMCRSLDMGTAIFNTDLLNDPNIPAAEKSDRIFNSNGFAEVMPEHKFQIVQTLRERGLVVGMTGDGVNDAPALKRADIGIAVDGATDAAKAAADIVLTLPGLSVIIDAITRSRKIFQRMRNYAIYRIACTIQLLLFFFFAIITINAGSERFYRWSTPTGEPARPVTGNVCATEGDAYFEAHFTLPVLSLVLITILNDVSIITISHDKVVPASQPQKWDLREVVIISIVLGGVALLGSMLLLVFGLQANCTQPEDKFWGSLLGRQHTAANGSGQHWYVTYGQMQTIMYLKVSLSDFLTVFAARTRSFFWERRPGYALLGAFFFATGCSTLFSLFWPASDNSLMAQLIDTSPNAGPQSFAPLTVWVFDIIFFVIQDLVKVASYWVLDTWVFTENRERINAIAKRSAVAGAVADMRRGEKHRPRLGREASTMHGGMSSQDSARIEALTRQVERLSSTVQALLQQQQRDQSSVQLAGGLGNGAAAAGSLN